MCKTLILAELPGFDQSVRPRIVVTVWGGHCCPPLLKSILKWILRLGILAVPEWATQGRMTIQKSKSTERTRVSAPHTYGFGPCAVATSPPSPTMYESTRRPTGNCTP